MMANGDYIWSLALPTWGSGFTMNPGTGFLPRLADSWGVYIEDQVQTNAASISATWTEAAGSAGAEWLVAMITLKTTGAVVNTIESWGTIATS